MPPGTGWQIYSQDRPDLERGGPLVLEYIEANPPKLIDIRMAEERRFRFKRVKLMLVLRLRRQHQKNVLDLCEEANFRRVHGIFLGKKELELEYSTYSEKFGHQPLRYRARWTRR